MNTDFQKLPVNIFKVGCLFQRLFLGLSLYYLHLVNVSVAPVWWVFTSGPQNCTPSSNRSKFLDFSIFNPSTFLLSRMRNCLLHVNGSRLGAGGRDIYRTNTFALRASAGHTAQHIQEPPFQTEENIWKDRRICPSVKLCNFPSLKPNVDRSKVWICSICSDHVVAPIFLGHIWNFFWAIQGLKMQNISLRMQWS